MDPRTKTQHQIAVDRAISALGTEAGSRRVLPHLTSPVGAAASGVTLEDLAEALRRFRERSPT